MLGLFRIRRARVYLVGQVFSLFGDSCLWLAMGVWVKTLTDSNTQAGLVFFFFTAPSLLAPLLGLVVDRFPRRRVLLATNTATAGAVLVLLLVHGPGQVWLIDVVMFAYGVSYGLIGPAQSALLTVIVPAEFLVNANAALRTLQAGFRLLGPLTGVSLFVLVGAHFVVILDAITFLIPVIALALIRVDEPERQCGDSRLMRELLAGAEHLWQTVELRHLVIAAACTTTVFGFAETLVYAIVGDGLHRPVSFVAILTAIQGAGAIVGGVMATRLIRKLGEGRLAAFALLVAAGGAALQIPPALIPVAAGEILFGAAVPCLVISLITLTQRLTPDHLQGRTFAAAETMITTPQAISIALGAALIGIAGYRTLLGAMSVVTCVSAGYLLTRPELRPSRIRSRSHARAIRVD